MTDTTTTTKKARPEALAAHVWTTIRTPRTQREHLCDQYRMIQTLDKLSERIETVNDMYYSLTDHVNPSNDVSYFHGIGDLLLDTQKDTEIAFSKVSQLDISLSMSNPDMHQAMLRIRQRWVELAASQDLLMSIFDPQKERNDPYKLPTQEADPTTTDYYEDFRNFRMACFSSTVIACIFTTVFLCAGIPLLPVWKFPAIGLCFVVILYVMFGGFGEDAGTVFGQLSKLIFPSWSRATRLEQIHMLLSSQRDIALYEAMVIGGKTIFESITMVRSIQSEFDAVVEAYYESMLSNSYGDGSVILLTDEESHDIPIADMTDVGLQASKTVMKEKLFARLVGMMDASYASECPIINCIHQEFGELAPRLVNLMWNPAVSSPLAPTFA